MAIVPFFVTRMAHKLTVTVINPAWLVPTRMDWIWLRDSALNAIGRTVDIVNRSNIHGTDGIQDLAKPGQ